MKVERVKRRGRKGREGQDQEVKGEVQEGERRRGGGTGWEGI